MGWFGKQDETPPAPVQVAGKALSCVVCGHGTFKTLEGQLNTKAMSLMDLDWLNPSATCHVCSRCGHVHWFLAES